MKILVFSDIHIHPYRMFAAFSEGDNSRRLEILRRLEAIVNRANTGNFDCLVCAGDFFHEKLKIDVVSVSKAKKILVTLTKPLVMVSGTHDITFSGHSALSAIATSPSYDARRVIELQTERPDIVFDGNFIMQGKDGVRVLFVCIPSSPPSSVMSVVEQRFQLLRDRYDDLLASHKIVLLVHNEICGLGFGSIKSTPETGLDLARLSEMCDLVIAGHYHVPFTDSDLSKAFSLSGRVLIPGAAIPHSFADPSEYVQGGSIWEIDVDEEITIKRVTFDSPQFITVKASTIRNEDVGFREDCYYRIIADEPAFDAPENVRYVVVPQKRRSEIIRDAPGVIWQDRERLLEQFVSHSVETLKICDSRKLLAISIAKAVLDIGDIDLLKKKIDSLVGGE